jgi:Plavaka transposase
VQVKINHAGNDREDEQICNDIADFGYTAKISRSEGNLLLDVIHRCRPGVVRLPRSWDTILRRNRKALKHVRYIEQVVEYPGYWKMQEFKKVVVRAIDPLEQIGRMLINPEIMFGYKDDVRFNFTARYVPGINHIENERLYADIMSSKWAQESEEEVLNITPELLQRATLLPIIVNSDGVALGQTNRQVVTAMGACGNFSDRVIRLPKSKFLLGYIPKPVYPKEVLLNHLVNIVGLSRAQAELSVFYYERDIDRCFWNLVLQPIKEAYKTGVYMRVLGKPGVVILAHPVIINHVGDEPGQKRASGMFEGNTKHFCIHCDYTFESSPYDRNVHKKRDAESIIAMCKLAEPVLYKKLSEKRPRLYNHQKEAYNTLRSIGVHPWGNPFHSAPMGVNNTVFNFSYDILHTILGGMMKAILFSALVIVEKISSSPIQTSKYRGAKGLFDSRLIDFPNQNNCLPHVKQFKVDTGLVYLLSGKSNKQKGHSSNSMGRIPSANFVTLVLQTYFAIGTNGDILPNTTKFSYKHGKSGVIEDIGNVTKKVLSTIELVLYVYFQCKRSSHTDRSNADLRQSVAFLQAQYAVLRDLTKTVLNEEACMDLARKPHFLVHFDEIIERFGAIDHLDTNGFETGHIYNTTGNWELTSKR